MSSKVQSIIDKIRGQLFDATATPDVVSSFITTIRGQLYDTEQPYRWTDTDLMTYINAGLRELYTNRKDFFFVRERADKYPGDVSKTTDYLTIRKEFTGSLFSYVMFKAFSMDAGDVDNSALAKFYYEINAQWMKHPAEPQYEWSDESIISAVNEARRDIWRRRKDAFYDGSIILEYPGDVSDADDDTGLRVEYDRLMVEYALYVILTSKYGSADAQALAKLHYGFYLGCLR